MANRDSILNKLDIAKKDWVLEIGGGPTPFARCDILADRFVDDDTHRSAPLVVDRPTVICDAHYLPFLDDSFDYIFCSQLLEHLEKPDLFFREIARVGKKGYIETPNEIRERLFGWSFHRWVVDIDENGLVLKENKVEQAFGLFFHKLQLTNYEFARFCSASFDLLNVCYEWHGKPKFKFVIPGEYKLPSYKECIEAEDIPNFTMSEKYETKFSENFAAIKKIKNKIPKKLKQFIKQKFLPQPSYGNRHSVGETLTYLRKVLACPFCKEKVILENCGKITCSKCEKHFKIENGIPFMLKD